MPDILLQPSCLSICAALLAAEATTSDVGAPENKEMHPKWLRTLTQLDSDAYLTAINALKEAGYVSLFTDRKANPDKNVDWVSLTATGARAYQDCIEELRSIAESGSRVP